MMDTDKTERIEALLESCEEVIRSKKGNDKHIPNDTEMFLVLLAKFLSPSLVAARTSLVIKALSGFVETTSKPILERKCEEFIVASLGKISQDDDMANSLLQLMGNSP